MRKRNEPMMYDEIKKTVSITLTLTAIKKLDKLAGQHGLSRSEFVEQVIREVIQIQSC